MMLVTHLFFQVCGHVPGHPDSARGSDGAGHRDRGGRGQHRPPTQEPGSYFQFLYFTIVFHVFNGARIHKS